MFKNADYYDELRAQKLIRALFAWVVLEAHDKKCWNRVMGKSVSKGKQTKQGAEAHANSTCKGPQDINLSAENPSMVGLESALSDMSLGKSKAGQCALPYLVRVLFPQGAADSPTSVLEPAETVYGVFCIFCHIGEELQPVQTSRQYEVQLGSLKLQNNMTLEPSAHICSQQVNLQ